MSEPLRFLGTDSRKVPHPKCLVKFDKASSTLVFFRLFAFFTSETCIDLTMGYNACVPARLSSCGLTIFDMKRLLCGLHLSLLNVLAVPEERGCLFDFFSHQSCLLKSVVSSQIFILFIPYIGKNKKKYPIYFFYLSEILFFERNLQCPSHFRKNLSLVMTKQAKHLVLWLNIPTLYDRDTMTEKKQKSVPRLSCVMATASDSCNQVINRDNTF